LTENLLHITEQQKLRDKTAALLLEWAEERSPPFTGETKDGFADALVAAYLVAEESKVGLQRWIDAARRTGMSWTEIGETLGISKQAAQQRFRLQTSTDDEDLSNGHEIVRLGATAFNEMTILRDEGLKGNELVRTAALTLIFRPTEQCWEYRRRIGAAPTIAEMKRAGWTYVSSWLPFHYFKRPIAGEH
jgi:hypothetical protein